MNENPSPNKVKLFHRDKLVGIITDVTPEDMFQWSGYVELLDAAKDYQIMFDYFNDESREREPEEPDEEPLPFDPELLDDWFIEDQHGRREILHPVITDGEAFWRE